MDDFLASTRAHVEAEAPHLLALFDIVAGEARFARAWLDTDLRSLPRGAPVLEVGGGVFLLACQLTREGFQVTSIEPTGSGFGSFEELGAAILSFSALEGPTPTIARCRVEDFDGDTRFPLAFSVNVMEHVDSPDEAIARVSAVLARGGEYRFLCPNYLFPYEPHFNIPTFFGKRLTGMLLRERIERDFRVGDPVGLWKSINWITVPQVHRIVRSVGTIDARFHRETLSWMLRRSLSDREFAQRRAGWMVSATRVLDALGLLRLSSLVPATLQPIMDVRLTRRA